MKSCWPCDRLGTVAWIIVSVALAIFSLEGRSDARVQRSSTSFRLSGVVHDSLGRPIAKAEVELQQSGHVISSTHSDQKGSFLFESLKPGNYKIFAKKAGFSTAVRAAVIGNHASANLVITMASKQPITMQISLERARNDLAPQTGATAYRFDQ